MWMTDITFIYAQVDLVPGCCFRSPAKIIGTGERDCFLVGLDLVVLACIASTDYDGPR